MTKVVKKEVLNRQRDEMPGKISSNTGQRTKNALYPIIITFCLPVLLYLQTISFKLTYFDDNKIINNNHAFLANIGNIGKVFQTDAFIKESGYFYRPMQTLSYMVDTQIMREKDTWMYHFSNIILLGIIASLLFIFLKRLFVPQKLALYGTLLYCAHPLFVSSVAWIPARGDLLLMFFSLLSFIFFIDFLYKKNKKYLFYNLLTFTMALFSKETAVFLPVLFILYYFIIYSNKAIEKKYLVYFFYYLFIGIIWYWVRYLAISSSQSGNSFEIIGINAFLSNLRMIPESLAKFALPFNIAPIPGFSIIYTILGLFLLIFIFIRLFNKKYKTKKEVFFGFSWFLLMLFPSMLFKHEAIDYLNHRFFISLIGILILIIFTLPENWFNQKVVQGQWFLIVIIVSLSFSVLLNSNSYSDPEAFYNAAVAKNPNSVIAYNNRGVLFQQQGLLDDAISDYTMAIELKPDYANAYYGRGNAFLSQKIYDKAIADYNWAIGFKFADAHIYNNRGAAYIHLGLYDNACADFKMAEDLGSTGARANIDRFCNRLK